jgi:hypothetical protein
LSRLSAIHRPPSSALGALSPWPGPSVILSIEYLHLLS